MGRLVAAAGVVGLLFGAQASAREARAVIPVTVRVVHPAKVQLSTAPDTAIKSVTRTGATEWRMSLKASVSGRETSGVRFEVEGCDGAQAEWVADDSGEKQLKVVTPAGSSCEPVVVATVQADGAP